MHFHLDFLCNWMWLKGIILVFSSMTFGNMFNLLLNNVLLTFYLIVQGKEVPNGNNISLIIKTYMWILKKKQLKKIQNMYVYKKIIPFYILRLGWGFNINLFCFPNKSVMICSFGNYCSDTALNHIPILLKIYFIF